ncbi:MAG: DUF4214 domain-containing protein, partial [Pyrinomonadaceae bacterium]
RVFITNQRVGGNLSNTTQNALLGADVRLQANLYPEGLTGGSFSWTITGPYQLASGSTNTNVLNVRWTEPGTYNVRVNYLRNGVTITSSIDISVTLPTLTRYTATQGSDLIFARGICSNPFISYKLGCRPPDSIGIEFSATVQSPSTFVSDPAQSGIKYVQAVSGFRKRIRRGNEECYTRRNGESDVASGWQLDFSDPYEPNTRRFSEGNSLTLTTSDYPVVGLEDVFVKDDAHYVDDRFEMYVYYFAGPNPSAPICPTCQRPIGRLIWNWGGQVVFDSSFSPPYRRVFTLAEPTARTGTAIGLGDSTVPYQGRGRVQDLEYRQCPGGPSPITNQIDNTRYFVRQQYVDILHREPDEGGWDAWTSVITRCGFDRACIQSKRIVTARGFLESPENTSGNPLLANPGSPEYNREYARLCYTSFLLRQPDQGGWDAWTNYLNSHPGDYDTVVHGFIYSIEYRARFGPT